MSTTPERLAVDHRQVCRRLVELAESGGLDALCERFGVRVLTVFGSAAHDEGDEPAADLDVAVQLGDRMRLLDFVVALDDLVGPAEIDILDLDSAAPLVASEALVHCVPLYEDRTGAYAALQTKALGILMDTAWLRDLELKRLTG